MDLYFLEAQLPLTKTIGKGSKEPYPMVKNFTSHRTAVETPSEFFKAVKNHALLGHCLIKGTLSRALVNEPRAGTTRTDDQTQWLCLDFDRFETHDLDAQLTAMGLGDITYVLQFSSSHALPENEGTFSAHIFMLLDEPVNAPMLKAWLMQQNLTLFRGELRLSRDKNQLSWPLDISTCQNDKLLYISPPKFVGMKDPMGAQPRIQLVTRPLTHLPIERLGERHIDALKADAREALNTLRKAEGLKARTAGTSWVSGKEVVNKPTVASVTGIKDAGDWVRLNLNGGDSWAYCHPKGDFELLFDFKSDAWYKTKELVPGYYQDLKNQQQVLNATPTEDGDLILAFRDLRTASYFNGFWNPMLQQLDLYPAKNETQLDHWMRSHGRTIGDFIPVWEMLYEPREDWILDESSHRINTFRYSEYMRVAPRENTEWPHIQSVICHMLATEPGSDLYEHFVNWLACVFQRKHKPRTAYVCHGIEGTGKGFFANKIVAPLLGMSNFTAKVTENLEDTFNGFLENRLFVFIDEVDVDDFREKGRITSKLRNWITEPYISVRHMRRVAEDMPNYAAFFFSSNRPQPVFIPPTDRRYNVGNFQGTKLPRPDENAVAAELLKFAEFLAAHKASAEMADSIIDTPERQRIKGLALSSAEDTLDQIQKGDIGTLWLARTDENLLRESGVMNNVTSTAQAYNALIDRLAHEALATPEAVLTRDELLLIMQYNVGPGVPSSPNKFTMFLRHKGIETRRLRKNGQLCYGLAVEWKMEDWLRMELTQQVREKVRRVK